MIVRRRGKRPGALALGAVAAALLAVPGAVALSTRAAEAPAGEASREYVVLAWNDLGMHAVDPSYAGMALAPPGNNLWVQVIKRGIVPRLITRDIEVRYHFPENTTTRGKSDFWRHARALFGRRVRQGRGLTGSRLSGRMRLVLKPYPHWEARGIPLLPATDGGGKDPYQQAVITVTDLRTGRIVARTRAVVPVSDEVRCGGCHADGGVGGFSSGSAEGNILLLHDRNQGTRLFDLQPVLCSRCHASALVGTRGKPKVSTLSQAMHLGHVTADFDQQPKCYDCHPGPETQFHRTALSTMGPDSPENPNCEECHGALRLVGGTIAAGRRPWKDQPKCSLCHSLPGTDTGARLFKDDTGHGNIGCAGCHNSPHAWYPSSQPRDNFQPRQYQHTSTSIGARCSVCHTERPDPRRGPHTRLSQGTGYD